MLLGEPLHGQLHLLQHVDRGYFGLKENMADEVVLEEVVILLHFERVRQYEPTPAKVLDYVFRTLGGFFPQESRKFLLRLIGDSLGKNNTVVDGLLTNPPQC